MIGALQIPTVDQGTAGVHISYLYNLNSSLRINQEQIDEHGFSRSVNSVLLQADYGLNEFFSFSLVLPFLIQNERLSFNGQDQSINNAGLGDISVWSTYRGNTGKLLYSFSGSIKLPSGSTGEADQETGLSYPLSFQNGSGSVDFGMIGYTRWNFDPNNIFYWANQLSLKINTKGKGFEAHPNYRYGNIMHFNTSLNSSLVVGGSLMDIGMGMNYQYQNKDRFDGGFENENTGGHWVNYFLGMQVGFSPRFVISANAHIPVLQKVNGFQLTTSWIASLGVSYIIG